MELVQMNSKAAPLQVYHKGYMFSGIYRLSNIILSLYFSSLPHSWLPLNSSANT